MTKLLDLVGRNIFPFEVFRAHFSKRQFQKIFLTTLQHSTIKRFCFFLESRRFHGLQNDVW